MSPAARAGRRQVRWQHFSDRNVLRLGRMHHAVGNELTQRLLVGMLQLASAANGEMSARRDGMMRPRRQRAIGGKDIAWHAACNVSARRGDAIAARCDADYGFGFAHRNDAMAGFTARARSPAENAGDASRAAS